MGSFSLIGIFVQQFVVGRIRGGSGFSSYLRKRNEDPGYTEYDKDDKREKKDRAAEGFVFCGRLWLPDAILYQPPKPHGSAVAKIGNTPSKQQR